MDVYIAGYARTPFCRFNGQLASVSASDLGAHASAVALERAGIPAADVEHVYFGQVLQAGAGQNPARQAAIGAGIPFDVPALTVNAVCLSGMEALNSALRMIAGGEADVVLAGGQESMSLAPHLVNLRTNHRFGSYEMIDSAVWDGLTNANDERSMGLLTDSDSKDHGFERTRLDQIALDSHARAVANAGFLAEEIAPITLTTRRGSVEVVEDDGVRQDVSAMSLAALRPAFSPQGVLTAGNSSQITDGAAALLLVSEAYLRASGIRPLAKIEASATVAGPGDSLLMQPANAITRALSKADLEVEDLTDLEINEAFASVVLASADGLGVDPGIVNSRGGAIALGHPIGASGARIVGTLARQIAEKGGGCLGAAGICGGGGQGSAMILQAP